MSRNLIRCLLLGVICRLVFAAPLPYAAAGDVEIGRSGDPARFLLQGLWLSQERGYPDLDGRSTCTSLPPGYPVFLAALLSIRDSTMLVVVVQFVMSLASIALVHAVCTARPGRFTIWPCLLMACFPWIAVTATQIMSEGLGIFLSAVIAWLVMRQEQDRFGLGLGLLAGAVAVAACLVVPAVAFCMVGLWCVMFARSLLRPITALALAIGGVAILLPWQLHVQRATGRFAPQLLTPLARSYHGTISWGRTWIETPADFLAVAKVYIWPSRDPDYEWIPDRAFAGDTERTQAETLAREWRAAADGRRADDSSALYRPVDEFFAELAAKRTEVWRDRVRPTVLRAWNLWWTMPDVGVLMSQHVARLRPGNIAGQFEEGTRRGVVRLGLAALCAAALVLHAGVLGYFVWGAIRSMRRPSWFAAVVIAGVLVYTLISAASGYIESRRNLPFYPLLLLVVVHAATRCDSERPAAPQGTEA